MKRTEGCNVRDRNNYAVANVSHTTMKEMPGITKAEQMSINNAVAREIKGSGLQYFSEN